MNNFNPFVQSWSLEILINCYNRVSEHVIEKEGNEDKGGAKSNVIFVCKVLRKKLDILTES